MNHTLFLMGEDPQNIDLEDGVTNIGGTDSSDIFCHILKDSSLEFIFAQGTMYLQKAKDLHVWVSGQLVNQFPRTIQAGEALSLSVDGTEMAHFYFGNETTVSPDIPTVILPSAPEMIHQAPIHWKTVGQFTAILLTMSALFIGVASAYKSFFSSQEPVAVALVQSNTPPVNAYIQEVVGEQLLAIEEDETRITVRILSGTPQQNARWANDLEIYTKHINKDIFVIVIDPNDLVMQVKQDLKRLASHWQVTSDGLTVTVTGACTTDCASQHERLRNYQKQDVTIVDKIHHIPMDFKIHSITVSKNTAQMTISKNGQYTIVKENDTLYNLGTVNIIRYDGVELNTPYGHVFLPWNKS